LVNLRTRAEGSRAVVKMKRHGSGHSNWTLVMILWSHSLLSAHSRESLVVVGNTLSYGASEVIVNEESGGVRRSRFLVVAASSYLLS